MAGQVFKATAAATIQDHFERATRVIAKMSRKGNSKQPKQSMTMTCNFQFPNGNFNFALIFTMAFNNRLQQNRQNHVGADEHILLSKFEVDPGINEISVDRIPDFRPIFRVY